MAKTELPILEQRRIEANVIKPIYEEMVERLGKSVASEILTAAITRRAQLLDETVVGPDHGRTLVPEPDHDGTGQGRAVDDRRGLEAHRVVERVA